jgi:glyoxylase-like metal-dependent hydrolase (beta-lactamase superfamily II)
LIKRVSNSKLGREVAMKEYRIKPLLTGWFHMNWGLVMSPLASGYFADLPVFMFLIEGEDGEQIIVDGSYQHDHVPKFIFGPHRTPDLEVPEVLKRNGVDPLKIEKVLVTHLHHDHTGYLHLFENAAIYVQEQELLNSYFPMGYQAVGCYPDEWVDLVPKFKLVNGDFQVQEGIGLIFAPGHTAGHQAVGVNTSRGRAVIMGDAVYLYAGLAKRFPAQFYEVVAKGGVAGKELDLQDPEVQEVLARVFGARYGGYFGPSILNPGEIMRSLAKLDLMADIVIPGHDPILARMQVIPDDYDLE